MTKRNSNELSENPDGLNEAVGGLPQKEKQNNIPDARMALFEYNMDHQYRGLAIIFNHYQYKDLSIQLRDGTEKDVEALQTNLLLLGFEKDHIIVEHDLAKADVFNCIDRMRDLKSDVLKNCDCIAVFILSHGSKDNEICASDTVYDLYDLVEQYTSNNLKELAGKPKLFFVSASRGELIDEAIQVRPQRQQESNVVGDSNTKTVSQEQRRSNVVGISNNFTSDQQVYTHPIHADTLISLSSHHDHASIRNKNYGTWYIQDLCQIIKQFYDQNKLATSDINDLLLYTHFIMSQRVASFDNIQINEKKQIPTFNSALCRKLYFKPKPNKLS